MQIAEQQNVSEWIAAQPLSGSVATQSVVDAVGPTAHKDVHLLNTAQGVAGATTLADFKVSHDAATVEMLQRAERSGVPTYSTIEWFGIPLTKL